MKKVAELEGRIKALEAFIGEFDAPNGNGRQHQITNRILAE